MATSSLGPVLANVFMFKVETAPILNLISNLCFWRRFVYDSVCFVKKGFIKIILDPLNNFHQTIIFTFEEGQEKLWSFKSLRIIFDTEKNMTQHFLTVSKFIEN